MLEALGMTGIIRGCELTLDGMEVQISPGLVCVRGKVVTGGVDWCLADQDDGVWWVYLEEGDGYPWQLGREVPTGAFPVWSLRRTGGALTALLDARVWLSVAVWCEGSRGRAGAGAHSGLIGLGEGFTAVRPAAAVIGPDGTWARLPLSGRGSKRVDGALRVAIDLPVRNTRNAALAVLGHYWALDPNAE